MANCELTQNNLKELFDYDASTGIFNWKVSLTNSIKLGDIAGCMNDSGYQVIRINNKVYLSHRLAWLYMTGKWPKEALDHINRNRKDNRFKNLREANHANNSQNRSLNKNNKTGFMGVYMRKENGMFRAEISVNNKSKCLGSFSTAEAASEAYLRAKRELHAFCTY